MVPSDRLAAVLESLPHLDQFLRGELRIAGVAPVVGLRVRVREAEFVRREAARVGVDLLRPLAAGRLVQHVARRFVIVDAHPVAELPAQQRAGGHREDFAGQIPQRHLDAAGRPQEVVRGAIRARAGEVLRAVTQVRVEGVDLQRILAHQPRLDG